MTAPLFNFDALVDELVERTAQRAAELVAAQLKDSPPPNNAPEVMTTREAAGYLRCSYQMLEIARVKGGGPVFRKLGRLVRYARTDLDRWSAERAHRNTVYTQKGTTNQRQKAQL